MLDLVIKCRWFWSVCNEILDGPASVHVEDLLIFNQAFIIPKVISPITVVIIIIKCFTIVIISVIFKGQQVAVCVI